MSEQEATDPASQGPSVDAGTEPAAAEPAAEPAAEFPNDADNPADTEASGQDQAGDRAEDEAGPGELPAADRAPSSVQPVATVTQRETLAQFAERYGVPVDAVRAHPDNQGKVAEDGVTILEDNLTVPDRGTV